MGGREKINEFEDKDGIMTRGWVSCGSVCAIEEMTVKPAAGSEEEVFF